jgi:hypothetical protein
MSNEAEQAEFVVLRAERDRISNELKQTKAVVLRRQNNLVVDVSHPLRDFTASRADEIHLGYVTPNINAEEYQISSAWVNMVQHHLFHGLPHEDVMQYLTNF